MSHDNLVHVLAIAASVPICLDPRFPFASSLLQEVFNWKRTRNGLTVIHTRPVLLCKYFGIHHWKSWKLQYNGHIVQSNEQNENKLTNIYLKIIIFFIVYKLSCTEERFYSVWNGCWDDVHDRQICFDRLFKLNLFVPYVIGNE